MSTLPDGTVTFLFTDIEGSTRLIQQYPEAIERGRATKYTFPLLSSPSSAKLVS
jgi:hypothetical protein